VVEAPRISSNAALWSRVDTILDTLAPQQALSHGLGPLAANRLRATGQPVPPALAQEEKGARLAAMVAPRILERAREAYDGPLVLFKGPEVASRYPGKMRLFTDLDLLVPDARAARAAMLAAGFDEVEDPTNQYGVLEHHLTPVKLGQLPLQIELHSKPKWPRRLLQPGPTELFETVVPASLGVAGLSAPDPARHALLLATHAWAHGALRWARDLLDVTLLAAEADRAEIAEIAESWGIARLWASTSAAADWLFGPGEEAPRSVKVFARHLFDLREATVLENHLERWVSSFWLLPPAPALRRSVFEVVRDFQPDERGEPRRAKAFRIARSVRHAFTSARSEYGWKR
jgi:Uncharacterised nucleotidyltransferase